MVFTGRQRGRGRGGVISATTRKSNSKHHEGRRRSRDRDNSRSPSPKPKRPVTERLGPQHDEMGESATPSEMESLRITVGNEIYKERRRSPLRDRLGPPVEVHKGDIDPYEEERMYYGGAPDMDRRDSRGGQQGQEPYSMDRRKDADRKDDRYGDRDRQYDRHGQRERERERDRGRDRRDLGDSISKDRRDMGDRRDLGDSRDRRDMGNRRDLGDSRDRRDLGDSRDRRDLGDSRDRRDLGDIRDRREHDRYRGPESFDHRDERYRGEEFHDRGHRVDDPYYRDSRESREMSIDSRHSYDRPPALSPRMYREDMNINAMPFMQQSSMPSRLPPPEQVPAEPKPLKSILKKKSTTVPPVEPEVKPYEGGTYIPPSMESRLGPSPTAAPTDSGIPRGGIPGLGSYMDVEDEEKFLYGDSDARETYPPSNLQDRGFDSQWNYKNPDRGLVSKANDPYHQASEPRRDFHPQLPGNAPVAPTNQIDPLYGRSTFPVLERSQGHNMEPPYTAQKVPEEPPYKPEAPAAPQPPIHIEPPQADLLSIFTNKPTSAIPTSQPMEPVAQPVTTKTNYDPTIENILKSIGFDFEMSKRMQEKAKTVETKPKEEPELVGINQTASFLEGGLIDGNLKDSLFVKKGSEIDRKSGYDDLYSKDDPQAALLEEGIVFKRKRSSDGSKSEGSHHEQQKYPTSTAPVSSYPGYTGSYSQADQYPPSAYSYAHQGVPPGYTTASGVPYGYEASQHPGYAAPAKPRYADTGHSPIPSLASSNLKSVPIQDKNSSDAKKHRRTEKESSLDRERERAPSSSSLKELKNVDSPRSKSESTKSLPLENIRVISAVDSGSQRLVLPPKSEQSKYVLKQSDDWDTPKSKKIGSSPKVGEKRTLSESSDHSQKSRELSSKQIEKLGKEKEIRQQRILALEEELQKLRKQQNEIMRKKRRQKDGHKDPILMQNSKLQEEIAQQISKLRKASEQNEKRMSTPDKKDGPPESKKLKEQKKDEPTQKPPPKSEEITEPQEKKVTAKDVRDKLEAASNTEQKPKQFSFQVKGELKVRYEYFDQGIHWCKSCNIVYSSLQIYMQHLHTANHLKSLSQYDKPWTPEEMKNPPKKPAAKKTSVLPIKGSEFLIPTSGFWCSLCKVLVGDIACGEFHMKSDAHHENYLAYTKDNPFYEQRRNLDKATALSSKREENLKNREIERKFELNPEQKQKDKRIKEKQKNFEKEVKELDDDEPQRHSTSSKKMLPISKLSKPGKDVPDPKTEKDGADVKKAVEEAKKAIEVKIFKKAGGQGNPTLQQGKAIPTITQRKRNTVLPPWTPVSKSGTAPGEKKLVTAEDILKAFSGKSKEKEKEEEEAKKKKEEEQRLVEETKKIEEMTKKQENMQQAKSNVVSADIPLPKGSYGHRAKDDWESPKKAVKLGPKPLMDLNIPPPLPFGQPGMNIGPVPPQIPFPQQNVRPNINIRPPNIGPYSGQTRGIPNVNVRPPNVGPTSAKNAQTKASSNTGSASITQTKTSAGNNTKNMATTPQTQKKGPPKAAPEIQSPDRVHEDEDVQFVSAHNKKVGDLVEIKDDSSSNDSVIVPIETMDALKPIKQNSVSEVELVAVAPDVESDEESVASSISMHMGSDYEVIDDIEQS